VDKNKTMASSSVPTATARIQSKKQTLDDAYAPPANFLEIDVLNPRTHGIGKKRYTEYEIRMRV
jgi:sorting nexin-3/12